MSEIGGEMIQTYQSERHQAERSVPWRFPWLAPAMLCLVAFFGGGMNGANCADVPPAPDGRIISNAARGGPRILVQDHVLGDVNAPVTLVEYAELPSTPSGRFARNELPILMEEFIDTGKVRFVFRHFPLSGRGEPSARAAECAADEDMFFEYLDAVFADEASDPFSDMGLGDTAEDIGLDRATFDACLAGNAHALRVQHDVISGQALGVSRTPTFFVDEQIFAGFQTADDLGDAIRRRINELNGD